MKKILLSITLLFAVLLPTNTFAQDIKLKVNGQAIYPDVAPFIKEGRTMVPVRFIGEALGMKVTYEKARLDFSDVGEPPDMMTVLTTANGRKIFIDDFGIDCSDGITYTTDELYVIKNNRTFVQIRYIANALNMDITWDSKNNLVELKDSTESKPIPIYFKNCLYDHGENFKSNNLFIIYKNGHYLLNGYNVTLEDLLLSFFPDERYNDDEYYLNKYKTLFNGLDVSEYIYFQNNYFILSPDRDKVEGISAR